MYRIAVCDDEKVFAESLVKCIGEYMDTKDFAYQIDSFYRIDDLRYAMEKKQFDLLFLDILVREASGMSFAHELREKANDIKIIFISSNTDYALEAFSVYPVTFLAKPIERKDVHAVLDRMISQFVKKQTLIINDKKNGKTVVPCESISYFESQGHDIVVRCSNRDTLSFNGVFSDYVSKLTEPYFFKCHRSYAVNLHYVHRLQNSRFVMTDGSIIPISKPLYKQAQERFASMIE